MKRRIIRYILRLTDTPTLTTELLRRPGVFYTPLADREKATLLTDGGKYDIDADGETVIAVIGRN